MIEGSIKKEIDKARKKIKRGPADKLLLQKPFAKGMYIFAMFMLNYFYRVRKQLKIDYDSFMIIQVIVSHNLYQLERRKNGSGTDYNELETEWEQMILKYHNILDILPNYKPKPNHVKLTFSSVCLVLGLPKETVRRKIINLTKKNLLKISKKDGILLGPSYKEIFRDFVPQTVLEVSKLLKNWERNGIIKSLLEFRWDS